MIGVTNGTLTALLNSVSLLKGSSQGWFAKTNFEEWTGNNLFAFRSFAACKVSCGSKWIYFHFSSYCPFSKFSEIKGLDIEYKEGHLFFKTKNEMTQEDIDRFEALLDQLT